MGEVMERIMKTRRRPQTTNSMTRSATGPATGCGTMFRIFGLALSKLSSVGVNHANS